MSSFLRHLSPLSAQTHPNFSPKEPKYSVLATAFCCLLKAHSFLKALATWTHLFPRNCVFGCSYLPLENKPKLTKMLQEVQQRITHTFHRIILGKRDSQLGSEISHSPPATPTHSLSFSTSGCALFLLIFHPTAAQLHFPFPSHPFS